MDEVEYVVPPVSGNGPNISSNKAPQNPNKDPKKPNKALEWVKSHKLQSVAGLIMVVIIVLVGTVMVTGQKIPFFGLQLNPLYQQANCPPPIDPVLQYDKDGVPVAQENIVYPDCGGGGGGLDPARITINGTFADGKVGVPYSQDLTVSGTTSSSCGWSVVSTDPKLDNANFVAPENGMGPTATFVATPLSAGTYQVTIHVVCGDGRPQTTQVFPWKVGAATSGNADITATFSNGTVGQEYTTNVTASKPFGNCNLALVSIAPSIPGATLSRIDNVQGPTNVAGMFTATPQSPGEYTVKISLTCNPAVGDGPSSYIEKDFKWTVNGTKMPPIPGNIEANFNDGKVAQAYTTTVTAPDALRDGAYDCTMAITKINPTVTGATLSRIKTTDPAKPLTYSFAATPQAVGTYTVSITMTCIAAVNMKETKVDKDFTWKVTAVTSGGGGSGGGSGSGGSSSAICDMSKLKPVYRWWNNIDKDHFFTTNQGEKPNGYKYEGIAGYVFKEQVSGSVPIYRSYKLSITAHYYATTNDAAQYGYNPEGILGYGFTESKTGTAAWYRLHAGWNYNDYIQTISTGERTAILAGAAGFPYVDEGIAAYICPPDQPAS